MSMFFVSAGAPSDAHSNAQISHEDAAPEPLNFNDPQAVDAAHQTFVNQGLPARWRDALLAAPPTDDDRHAFATLRLRKLADQAQPYPTGMPGDLEQAVTTLANHLSPTGRTELLQSLEVGGGDNAFAQYLTDQDRWHLAADVLAARAKTCYVAWRNGTSAEDAGPPGMADYRHAASLYERAGLPAHAADALKRVGAIALKTANFYKHTDQPQRTQEAWRSAVNAYLDEVELRRAAGQRANVADALERLAGVYTLLEEHDDAARSLTAASESYELADLRDEAIAAARKAEARYMRLAQLAPLTRLTQLALAVDACKRVAQLYSRWEKYGAAAHTRLRLAGLYGDLAQPKLAREAHGDAARAFVQAKNWAMAADAFWESGEYELAAPLFRSTEQPDRAGDAYAAAAARREQEGAHTDAERLYREAAKEYELAGMWEMRAQAIRFADKLANPGALPAST
ncbi:hypothetical protein MB84_28650 (plasmid) [Pandoraea oxalativorans]|uniref:Gamma-soluble NSF attachment protein n=2 Tax=Pandoraea oxalativorans TaxID=573737 RepID=A0A0G3IHX3_9BURK|nr:hypothetical protein MB84_28650 [Pandoraea oxalativorans]